MSGLELWQKILEYRESHRRHCLVTVLSCRGSYPQEIGAKILVDSDGLAAGTIGGGKIEFKAIELAQALLRGEEAESAPQIKKWNLQTDVGMSCGGEATLLFESFVFMQQMKVAVFGAGHVAQKLIPLLWQLDTEIIWVDPRPDWLAKIAPEVATEMNVDSGQIIFAKKLRKICSDKMDAVVSLLPCEVYIVSITSGHSFDLPILKAALAGEHTFPYVGCMGSEVKAQKMRRELKEAGCEWGKIEKLFCPIGEQFGSNQPMEVALSIVAQLIKFRDAVTKKNNKENS